MPRVVLVNPSLTTMGYSVITPRWLFVLGQATPVDLVGDPILIDEAISPFDSAMLRPDDLVGIGISTGNCRAGYDILRQAKSRGATVVMGGIHPTIFPDEPLEMGADAVVTGNGDVIWAKVVEDFLNRNLQKKYLGGRVPGEALLKARWDLLDPRQYMFPTVQTVAGCPENCSFCSVWVTDGRQARQRLASKIIDEVNELYAMGIRWLIFADDNFNPSTLGRIAREPSPEKRKQFEEIRAERLRFFDEYDRNVPKDIYAFTQMTTEVVSDPEYLSAMHDKMRLRGALIGIESFSEDGLRSANKTWNPTGKRMVETIQKIEGAGIMVLSSVICGLESDTVQTIRTMSQFACDSGSTIAQFAMYHPYPGTKDFYEMVRDSTNRAKVDFAFTPKHATQITGERFWLKSKNEADLITHGIIPRDELFAEHKKCWEKFYSMKEILRRARSGSKKNWPFVGKFTYVLFCVVFKRIYGGQGMAADGVRKRQLSMVTKIWIKIAVGAYNHYCRTRSGGHLNKPWAEPKRVESEAS